MHIAWFLACTLDKLLWGALSCVKQHRSRAAYVSGDERAFHAQTHMPLFQTFISSLKLTCFFAPYSCFRLHSPVFYKSYHLICGLLMPSAKIIPKPPMTHIPSLPKSLEFKLSNIS